MLRAFPLLGLNHTEQSPSDRHQNF